MNILLPKALHRGDTIGLISPSSTCAQPEKIEQAMLCIEHHGYRAKRSRYLNCAEHDPARNDRHKLHDIHEMFSDPEVSAIFSLRGGAGATRLLDRVDYKLVAENPKIFVGYSDITALSLALFAKAGLVNFSGPMITTELLAPSIYTEEHFWNILSDPLYSRSLLNSPHHRFTCIKPGTASGTILGGNLSVLSSMVGTPYLPSFHNALLFIEDVNEPAYRIDRMLSQLFNAGLAQQCNGLMFGQFSRNPSDENKDYRFDKMFAYYADKMPEGTPVMTGLSYGHIEDLMTIPVGAPCRLEVTSESISFGTIKTILAT